MPLAYVTEMGPFNIDRSAKENDCKEMEKFKDNYNAKMAFKVVFYSKALVTGAYDAAKFESKNDPEKIRKSKTQTWYLLISQEGQSASDWLRAYSLATGRPY